GLFLRRGHLVAARAAESTGLHRLVLDACRRNGDGLCGGALEVSRMSSSGPFGVLVTPLQAGGLPRVNGLPAAVAYITDPDNQAQTWRELLHRLYGLTAGETEVALLALGGKSITEVAELRGVTHRRSSLGAPGLIHPYKGSRRCAASSPARVRDTLRRTPLPSREDRMKAA